MMSKGWNFRVIIVENWWKWKLEDGPLREKEERRWNSEAEAKETAHGVSVPLSQWQFGNRLDTSIFIYYFY